MWNKREQAMEMNMKRYGWCVLFGLFAAFVVSAAEPSDNDAILAIEKAWADAVVKKDKAFFERSFVENFTYVNEAGVLSKGRAAYVEGILKIPAGSQITDSNEMVQV